MSSSSSSSPHLLGISLALVVIFQAFLLSHAYHYPSSNILVGGGRGRKVGGRTEVKDVESNHGVQELGSFAVEEYNRRLRRGWEPLLSFYHVVAAQRQVVSGIKYLLKVVVAGGERYDAVVVVKPWLDSRVVVSFAHESSPK